MTTFGDRLYHQGGVPVGGKGYQGWWKDDTYFVDYDNGSTNNGGKKPDDACKYLEDAIDLAGEFDTIYIRPRDPNITGGDSNYIVPASSTNWTIANTKEGLSLIGTGLGMDGHGMAYQTYLRGRATSPTTGAVLKISAPFVAVENLAFHRGSVGATGRQVSFDPGLTSFAGSINNCLFRFHTGTDQSSGALYIHDAWYTMVYNSVFYRNVVGISLHADQSSVRCVTIRGNIFQGLAASVNNHILSNGNMSYVTIVDNHFIDAIPTKGDNDYYIYVSGSASTGLVANNTFGTTTITAATLCTLNGLTFAKNFVSSTNAMTS